MKNLENDVDTLMAIPKRILNFKKERPSAPMNIDDLDKAIAGVLYAIIREGGRNLRITNSKILGILKDDFRYNDIIWHMQMMQYQK